MPNSVIKSIADDTGKSIAEVEKLWDKAKAIVKSEYPHKSEDDDSYWALVTSITKKMAQGKNESAETPTFLDILVEEKSKLDSF